MKYQTYPKYRPSGIDWIGEIPEGWEVQKLKNVADIFISNVDKKISEGEKTILLCNYVDVYKNDFIDSSIEFMKATATVEQIKKLKVEKLDVVITKDSETPDDIAVPALVIEKIEDLVCGYHLALVKSKGKLYGKYLFRVFQSQVIRNHFEIEANGVTRFGLSTYPIKNLQIYLPPLTEQQKIADFLNKKTKQLDNLIKKDKQLIELLKERRIALINKAVTKGLDDKVKLVDSGVDWIGEIPEGWEVHRLKYKAIINNKNLGDNTKSDLDITYLDISNVDSSGNLLNFENYIYENAPSRAKRLPMNGDTIISTVRTYLKAIAHLKNIPENLVVSTGFAVLHPNDIDSEYLYYCVCSEKFVQNVISCSKGVAYPAINSDELGDLYIVCPNIEIQKDIVKYIKENFKGNFAMVKKTKKRIRFFSI